MNIIDTQLLFNDRIDVAYLDCFTDNLAVLLCHLGIEDVRTPFACQWDFDFDLTREPTAVLEHTEIETMIHQQTGCRVSRRCLDDKQYVEACSSLIQKNIPVLLFGDTYHMPWLPYYEQEHIKHSFLIDGVNYATQTVHIIDAYMNHTAWGLASPTETTLSFMALHEAILALDDPDAYCLFTLELAEKPVPSNTRVLLQQNARQILHHIQDNTSLLRFNDYYRQHVTDVAAIKQFTLSCWSIARSRALHQLWLADIGRSNPEILDPAFAVSFQHEISQPWQQVSEFAYILLRRVNLGRRAPESCFQTIEETLAPHEIQAARTLRSTQEQV